MNIYQRPPKDIEALCEQIFMLRLQAYRTLGWTYQSPGIAPQALTALRAYDMLYSRSGQFVSHGSVSGMAYGQQGFSLADVTAPPMPDGSYQGFGGVILSLDHKASFDTRTIICRDRGLLNPKTVQEMQRVGLVDREFERRFEVYSSDQTEARALITPDFMERLMQFDDEYLGRNIQCGFLGHKLHICLEIDDRFDFNRLHIADNYKAIRSIVLHELAAVLTVLELGQRLQKTIGVQTDDTMDAQRGVYYADQLQQVITALDVPPEAWQKFPKIDPNLRYSHFLFDGYLGQMVKPIYSPLSPLRDGVNKP